jgi:hypothetical protein
MAASSLLVVLNAARLARKLPTLGTLADDADTRRGPRTHAPAHA